MGRPSAVTRLERKEAAGMEELIAEYIRTMKLSSGISRQRVYEAWDNVSGAAPYTNSQRYDRGVLYCTLSSSVVRSRLFPQRETILREINSLLEKDKFFDRAGGFVKSIVLK